MFLNLTARLKMVADMLPECRVMADVGCDHGRLAAFVLQNNFAERVIASDISGPSLEKADRLLRKCGLRERCDLRLGDGLSVLRPDEADVIVMTGMGGPEIIRMISSVQREATYIVQAQNHTDDVRRFLASAGYMIEEERICREKERFYEIIRFSKGQMTLTEQECELGPVNLARKEPVLYQLIEKRIEILRGCIDALGDAETPKAAGDRAQLLAKLALYTAI